MIQETKVKCFKCLKWVVERETKLALYRRYNQKSASYSPLSRNCQHIDKVLEDKKINIKK